MRVDAFAKLIRAFERSTHGKVSISDSQAPSSATQSNWWKTVALLLGLLLLLLLLRSRVHFDWRIFLAHLHGVSPLPVAVAAPLILSTNILRAWRWSVFLRSTRRVHAVSLLGSQFMGFAAVALFGRIADLTRPYLVSRRTGLPLATQIAVYTVERIFDLGAVAILFSTMLFFTPAHAPHRQLLVRSGLLSLAATLFLVGFAAAIRLAGTFLALSAPRLVGQKLGHSLAAKLLSFRDGLNTVASLPDLLVSLALSLAMWLLIAEAYVQSTHAFPLAPALSSLGLVAVMPLLAASMGGSLLQLPILGWFTQIAITATAMHTLYDAPIEDATACAAVLLIVNTLVVIPVGLAFARIEKLSLRAASRSSSGELDRAQST